MLLISSKRILAWSFVLEAQTISVPPLERKNSDRSIPAMNVVFPFFLLINKRTSLNLLRPVSANLKPYAHSNRAFSHNSSRNGSPLNGDLVCLSNGDIQRI